MLQYEPYRGSRIRAVAMVYFLVNIVNLTGALAAVEVQQKPTTREQRAKPPLALRPAERILSRRGLCPTIEQ